MMQIAVKTKKPRKQAVSGRFWAERTYRGRIKDDHKIDGRGGNAVLLHAAGDRHCPLPARFKRTSVGQTNPVRLCGRRRHGAGLRGARGRRAGRQPRHPAGPRRRGPLCRCRAAQQAHPRQLRF